MSLRMQVRAAEYCRSSAKKIRKQERKRQKMQKLGRTAPAKLLNQIAQSKLKPSHVSAESGYQALAAYVSGTWRHHEVSRQEFIDFIARLIEAHGHRFLQSEAQIDAHRRLLAWRRYWLRGVESVKLSQRKGSTANARFQSYLWSLAMGLLAKYSVPKLMLSVWKQDDAKPQEWFVRLAQGKSLYGAIGIPPSISRKVLHRFVNLQIECESAEKGLIYAQALESACTTEQAQEIIQNTQANYLADNAFWLNVFRFIARKGQELPDREVNPLIDYLNDCYRRNPKFNLKGRKMRTLLAEMHEWHDLNMFQNNQARFSAPSKQKLSKWKGLNIDNFCTWYQFEEQPELNGRYRIVQLNNSRLLEQESASQKHCVASYVQSCLNGYSSIWSFAKQDPATKVWERLLTIEVQPNRRQIVQIRGKRNARPEEWQMAIIREWAMQSRLRLGGYY